MTVLEVIKLSSEYLEKRGVDSSRLQTELLLAHVLEVPRLKLYLDFERQLSETELAALRQLVKRRGEREPLQYLLGSTSFCGIELAVTPAVLIPRPETELLVEHAWKFLAERGDAPGAVLDFGAGSGCIAIAVARKFPQAEVHAIDASAEALRVARSNAERAGARVHFHQAASIQELAAPAQFNLILSNPPYIPAAELASLQPEVRDHEPRLALDGGADGLDYYRVIAAQAPQRLDPEGCIILELGHSQEKTVPAILEKHRCRVERVVNDYAGTPRILIARHGK